MRRRQSRRSHFYSAANTTGTRAAAFAFSQRLKQPTAHMDFPQEIRTRAKRVRPIVRTAEEAVRLIDHQLPREINRHSRWTFARALLLVAQQSGKKRDLTIAYRQFRQALSNDKLLVSEVSEGKD